MVDVARRQEPANYQPRVQMWERYRYAWALVLGVLVFFAGRASNRPTSDDLVVDAQTLSRNVAIDEQGLTSGEAAMGGSGKKTKPRQLIHVMNIRRVDPPISSESESDSEEDEEEDLGIFHPIGYKQWISIASVRTAQRAYHDKVAGEMIRGNVRGSGVDSGLAFDYVTIVCAVLEDDLSVLNEILLHYCDRVSILERSTATVYPQLQMKPLPFVQDMINAGTSVGNAGGDEFYLMYMNSELGATANLYSWTEETLRKKKGKDDAPPLLGLTVYWLQVDFEHLPLLNRVHDHQVMGEAADLSGIMHDGQRITADSPFEAKDFASRGFMEQARQKVKDGVATDAKGKGCLVLHSSVVEAFDFGDLFVGHPPVGATMRDVMTAMLSEERAPSVASHEDGVFNIGYVRPPPIGGKPGDHTRFWAANHRGREEELRNIVYCPYTRDYSSDVYHLQNVVNCGRLFVPRRLDGGHDAGRPVPAFVRPGYERLYLENVGDTVTYSEETGLPSFEHISDRTREQRHAAILQHIEEMIENREARVV